MKRKAKEQIADGMSDIQSVLAALEDPLDTTTETHEPAQKSGNKNAMETEEDGSSAQSSKATASSQSLKIGEGKATPLSKSQRKRAL